MAETGTIIDALRSIHDPCCRERGISVVDMGLVRSVSVTDGEARVELILTSGWCPFASTVLESVKDRVEALDGIRSASVEITWNEAWTMDRLSDDARKKLVFLPEPTAVGNKDAYIETYSPQYRIEGR